MTVDQICAKIKEELLDQKWTGGVDYVFHANGVKASRNPDVQFYLTLMTPSAVVMPGEFISDPVHSEEPDYLVGMVVVRVLVAHQDSSGEALLLGANRIDGLTGSRGRGVYEIATEVQNAIKKLNALEGLEIQFAGKGAQGVIPAVENGTYRAYLDLNFEAVCTCTPVRPGPPNLHASVSGGNVSLSWTNPPTDAAQTGLVLRRLSGLRPPAIPAGGTGVAIAGFATSVVDAPGNGTWTYALSMGYNEPQVSTSTVYSIAAVTTVKVG